MRASLLLTASLLLLPLAMPNAVATSGCSGLWSGSASCTFACDSPTVSVKGHAEAWGAIASIFVSAECGFYDPVTGAWTGIYIFACSNSAPGTVSCSATAFNIGYPAPLVGKCGVSGNVKGSYGCSSP